MNKRENLLHLLKNDPLGLLKRDTPKNVLSHEEASIISLFEEIQNFFEDNGREPQSNIANIIEYKLFARLKAIRADANKVKILKKYDFSGLLKGEGIKELTIEDIISDDTFGLIDGDADRDIFRLKHVKPIERIKPEYLSRRKVCNSFFHYKDMFNILHEELSSKKRRLIKYISSDLKAGRFYALDGVLFFLKSVDGDINKFEYSSGERDRFDGRTLCVFDNGTQSDMLFRSLDKAMQIAGYSISDLIKTNIPSSTICDLDVLNGYIYILKSLNPNVQNIQSLYKIGHTTGSVAERIKNAKNEATYLFDDVEIVSTFRCLNIQSYNLEQTIHDFFSNVKLDIELLDSHRNSYKPREWFKVNLDVIEDSINLILTNNINEYSYDAEINQIIKKHTPSAVFD